MLNENAKKWVADLRANPSLQGSRFLHRDGKFCCFGRACVLAIENSVPVLVQKKRTSNSVLYDRHMGVLPSAVREWLGIRTSNGSFELPRCKQDSLIHCNDGTPWAKYEDRLTFSQIADIIESEPEGLFV